MPKQANQRWKLGMFALPALVQALNKKGTGKREKAKRN